MRNKKTKRSYENDKQNKKAKYGQLSEGHSGRFPDRES
jgi:hypothetical protein